MTSFDPVYKWKLPVTKYITSSTIELSEVVKPLAYEAVRQVSWSFLTLSRVFKSAQG